MRLTGTGSITNSNFTGAIVSGAFFGDGNFAGDKWTKVAFDGGGTLSEATNMAGDNFKKATWSNFGCPDRGELSAYTPQTCINDLVYP